jgi:hypothetical protein
MCLTQPFSIQFFHANGRTGKAISTGAPQGCPQNRKTKAKYRTLPSLDIMQWNKILLLRRNSPTSVLDLLFFRFRDMLCFRTEVVSPSPNPQPGGLGLRIYDTRRHGGLVIPFGIGQLGTSGTPLPVPTITVSPSGQWCIITVIKRIIVMN